MAKGDYYFPLYYRRLLTSTIGWKDDEFGAYVRLLIHQFDNNNSIPNDLEELALVAPSVKKNWKRLTKKFKESDAGLYNEVMSDIFNQIQGKKKANSENGSKGGRPKKPKAFNNENPNETELKPNGFKNESHLITNNQELITNTVLNTTIPKTVVGDSSGEIPPPASTTETDFVSERQEKIYQMFKRVTTWNPETIMLEVSRFMNKYSTVPINQCGPLVNSWAANYKVPINSIPANNSATIAEEIYEARKKEEANGHR